MHYLIRKCINGLSFNYVYLYYNILGVRPNCDKMWTLASNVSGKNNAEVHKNNKRHA